jgi:hypothetical protein
VTGAFVSGSERLTGVDIEVSVDQMMDLIVDHLSAGGRLLDKPTHFEARSGKF